MFTPTAGTGAGSPPVSTADPIVSGPNSPPQIGDVLSVSDGTWNNSPDTFSYAWFRVNPLVHLGELVVHSGEEVYYGAKTAIGTSTANYTVTAGDAGYLIGCDVTASNSQGSRTAESSVVGMVVASGYGDSYLAPQTINAAPDGANNYTLGTLAIGPADSRRKVLLFIGTNGGTACLHNSLTFSGGISFTKLAQSNTVANSNMMSAWQADVPIGTSLSGGVLNVSAPCGRMTMHGWTHGRGAVVDTLGVQGNTGTIDAPAGGVVFAKTSCTSSTAVACNFTGIPSEDFDAFTGMGTLYNAGGRYNNSGALESNRILTADWATGANIRLTAASFGVQV